MTALVAVLITVLVTALVTALVRVAVPRAMSTPRPAWAGRPDMP
jgi:hypothetical protein